MIVFGLQKENYENTWNNEGYEGQCHWSQAGGCVALFYTFKIL